MDAETTRDGVQRCPTGCDFDHLEIGTESETFLAVMGAPYQHVRCGKCGFNGDPTTAAMANNRAGAIAKWNAAARGES